jgi:hypothetical protein
MLFKQASWFTQRVLPVSSETTTHWKHWVKETCKSLEICTKGRLRVDPGLSASGELIRNIRLMAWCGR